MLDELYAVSSVLANKSKVDETTMLREESTTHTFAVECGLHKYLSAKLEQENVVHQEFGHKTLLYLALYQEAEHSKHFVSPSVVQTLLNFGADPHRYPRMLSQVVWHVTRCYLHEQEARQWARIIVNLVQARLVPTSMDVLDLTQAFQPYPQLWSKVQSSVLKPMKPSPQYKQPGKRDRCRPQ